MQLLNDTDLERSSVVANCNMNRERTLTGLNGYAREIGLEPVRYLRSCKGHSAKVSWLDLCCGSGAALIEAAHLLRTEHAENHFEIVGVDLVGMFAKGYEGLQSLRLVEGSLTNWQPDRQFDLITCVHGLHYIGDKLSLLARAASWLTEQGLFVANLDLSNIQLAGATTNRQVAAALREIGLDYDARKRIVRCQGHRRLEMPWRYLGANDRAGPNYTGQPAVNSYYERVAEIS